MPRIKISKRHQVTIPAEARKKLNIKAGDYLFVEVCDDSLVLRSEPTDYAEALRGLGSEIWKDVDPDEYVRAERDSWGE